MGRWPKQQNKPERRRIFLNPPKDFYDEMRAYANKNNLSMTALVVELFRERLIK